MLCDFFCLPTVITIPVRHFVIHLLEIGMDSFQPIVSIPTVFSHFCSEMRRKSVASSHRTTPHTCFLSRKFLSYVVLFGAMSHFPPCHYWFLRHSTWFDWPRKRVHDTKERIGSRYSLLSSFSLFRSSGWEGSWKSSALSFVVRLYPANTREIKSLLLVIYVFCFSVGPQFTSSNNATNLPPIKEYPSSSYYYRNYECSRCCCDDFHGDNAEC